MEVFSSVEAVLSEEWKTSVGSELRNILKQVEQSGVVVSFRNGHHMLCGTWTQLQNIEEILKGFSTTFEEETLAQNPEHMSSRKVIDSAICCADQAVAKSSDTYVSNKKKVLQNATDVSDYDEHESAEDSAGLDASRDPFTTLNSGTSGVQSIDSLTPRSIRKSAGASNDDTNLPRLPCKSVEKLSIPNIATSSGGKSYKTRDVNSKELLVDADVWQYIEKKMAQELQDIESFGATLEKELKGEMMMITIASSASKDESTECIGLVFDSIFELYNAAYNKISKQILSDLRIDDEEIIKAATHYIDQCFPDILIKRVDLENQFHFIGPEINAEAARVLFRKTVNKKMKCNKLSQRVQPFRSLQLEHHTKEPTAMNAGRDSGLVGMPLFQPYFAAKEHGCTVKIDAVLVPEETGKEELVQQELEIHRQEDIGSATRHEQRIKTKKQSKTALLGEELRGMVRPGGEECEGLTVVRSSLKHIGELSEIVISCQDNIPKSLDSVSLAASLSYDHDDGGDTLCGIALNSSPPLKSCHKSSTNAQIDKRCNTLDTVDRRKEYPKEKVQDCKEQVGRGRSRAVLDTMMHLDNKLRECNLQQQTTVRDSNVEYHNTDVQPAVKDDFSSSAAVSNLLPIDQGLSMPSNFGLKTQLSDSDACDTVESFDHAAAADNEKQKETCLDLEYNLQENTEQDHLPNFGKLLKEEPINSNGYEDDDGYGNNDYLNLETHANVQKLSETKNVSDVKAASIEKRGSSYIGQITANGIQMKSRYDFEDKSDDDG